jgi:hypothetical protein
LELYPHTLSAMLIRASVEAAKAFPKATGPEKLLVELMEGIRKETFLKGVRLKTTTTLF